MVGLNVARYPFAEHFRRWSTSSPYFVKHSWPAKLASVNVRSRKLSSTSVSPYKLGPLILNKTTSTSSLRKCLTWYSLGFSLYSFGSRCRTFKTCTQAPIDSLPNFCISLRIMLKPNTCSENLVVPDIQYKLVSKRFEYILKFICLLVYIKV